MTATATENPFGDLEDNNGTVGATQMEVKIEQNETDVSPQSDQHEAPSQPSRCVNWCNWFPLRLFCFAGGALLVTCSILDFLFNGDTFIQFIIRIYLLFFGIVIMMIESPTCICIRKSQLRTFFYFRLLSRMWGRAWFYLSITILCFYEFNQENAAEFTIVAGFYLMFIAILSFIISKTAATKYNRIYVYIASGCEGDALNNKFIEMYDKLSESNSNGQVTSFEINKIGQDAGRVLSNAERHAIQSFLDESCHGYVNKQDWIKQFALLQKSKQRFL
eukprot:239138_1